MMSSGNILFFLIFPVMLEGCCVKNHQKKPSDLQQDPIHQHYRAVEGESFMMPCIKSVNGYINVVWSRTSDGQSFKCGQMFPAEAKHSGKYKSITRSREMFLDLHVVANTGLGCFQPKENKATLRSGSGGKIPCPGHNCSDNTDVRWYKGNVSVSELSREICDKNGVLQICEVTGKYDAGEYYCDRQINEQGVRWTVRRAVRAKVVCHSHFLMCDVFFPYDGHDDEDEFSGRVQWYMNDGGNKGKMVPLDMEAPKIRADRTGGHQIEQRGHIKVVTPKHLNHTYTCIASNADRNVSVTIKLEKRSKGMCLYLVGYPFASLLVVAGLGIILQVNWLELQIIYRSYFQLEKYDAEEKRFDVFLTYAFGPASAEPSGSRNLLPRSGGNTDEDGCESCMDTLASEEGDATMRPLIVQLHHVLEEQWGYRLCLLERDILPGGAYTNDVVLAIQRSQMLICVLSADYLCNSNAVFALESGIQALLQNSTPRLLLIWTCRDSASLNQDAPLPELVKRALKVLPSLNWTSGKPASSTCNFWASLRKALPSDRKCNLPCCSNDLP